MGFGSPGSKSPEPPGRQNIWVSILEHYYRFNQLHDVTTSTHRRARLFDAERFRNRWVATLAELRQKLKFRIIAMDRTL